MFGGGERVEPFGVARQQLGLLAGEDAGQRDRAAGASALCEERRECVERAGEDVGDDHVVLRDRLLRRCEGRQTRADAAVVRLDPGLAFGTGTHPTTALCLAWLDGQQLAGSTVLDFGCGSGILAIAALKLGAARAVGVDNDPQALIATHDNAERNDVGARLSAFAPQDEPVAQYDVVVANILAVALDALAPLLAQRTRAGGTIALSGILAGQEPELLVRYAEWFDDLAAVEHDGWIRIDGRRRAG